MKISVGPNFLYIDLKTNRHQKPKSEKAKGNLPSQESGLSLTHLWRTIELWRVFSGSWQKYVVLWLVELLLKCVKLHFRLVQRLYFSPADSVWIMRVMWHQVPFLDYFTLSRYLKKKQVLLKFFLLHFLKFFNKALFRCKLFLSLWKCHLFVCTNHMNVFCMSIITFYFFVLNTLYTLCKNAFVFFFFFFIICS